MPWGHLRAGSDVDGFAERLADDLEGCADHRKIAGCPHRPVLGLQGDVRGVGPGQQAGQACCVQRVPGAGPSAAAQGRRNGGAGHELAELWDEISEAVSQVVDRLTFGDLVTRTLERRRTAKPMYHI